MRKKAAVNRKREELLGKGVLRQGLWGWMGCCDERGKGRREEGGEKERYWEGGEEAAIVAGGGRCHRRCCWRKTLPLLLEKDAAAAAIVCLPPSRNIVGKRDFCVRAWLTHGEEGFLHHITGSIEPDNTILDRLRLDLA
ncbi:hypothetical protein B296_00032044 [Ensete ventricosum]|uniref:Uncharacterized protein n=1 Tax=Ensete ventricosum TaxID=4639 RepID=A0A427A8H2_ENSVE|nr:hypothetical protein B296_00032044 [Ensete ventricosum]